MILALIFSIAAVATAADQPTREQIREASSWGAEHRRYVVDAAMSRAASEEVASPVCRVTTLRASGSFDRFEYAIRLVEPCPVVNERGQIVDEPATGEFVIPEGAPVTDQLADAKLRRPELSEADMIKTVRLRRIAITASDVRRLLDQLSAIEVSILPPTNLVLDAPTYELASATGMTERVVQLTAASRGRGEQRLMKIVAGVAAAHGYPEERLQYDSSRWN